MGKSLSDIVSDACNLWQLPNRQNIACHSDVGITIACVAMEEARKRLAPTIHAQRKEIEKLRGFRSWIKDQKNRSLNKEVILQKFDELTKN